MVLCHNAVNGCSCQCFVSKQMPEKLGGFFVKICWYVLILAEATDQNTDVPKNWCRKPYILPSGPRLSKTFIDQQFSDLEECISQKEPCNEASKNQKSCAICNDNVPTRIVIPCGHDGLCIKCVEKLIKEPKIESFFVDKDGRKEKVDEVRKPVVCPICRALVFTFVVTYRS